MPLRGYRSLCNSHAPQIVSRDKGNRQYHRGLNKDKVYVTHYKIDGVVIKQGRKCDYLLMNEERKTAYLIELKGSDLVEAARQLEATEKVLQEELSDYQMQYRIVANKCRTQDVRSSAYRRYQIRWREKLIQKTGFIEEDI